jgi:hypothetical protein
LFKGIKLKGIDARIARGLTFNVKQQSIQASKPSNELQYLRGNKLNIYNKLSLLLQADINKDMNKTRAFIEKLKARWGITSTWQVILILIVFACTGFSTLYVEEQIYKLFHIPEENTWWIAVLLFIFITLPLYNAILLVYGFIVGQFKFFWNFEKRFFGSFIRLFKRKV